MNVTNLPVEDRMRLYEEWERDMSSGADFSFGNDIDITPEQIEDASYIIPEWGIPVPQRYRDEKLAQNVNKQCITSNGIKGKFLGLTATYEDFYYRIETEDGVKYETCCAGIEFS